MYMMEKPKEKPPEFFKSTKVTQMRLLFVLEIGNNANK